MALMEGVTPAGQRNCILSVDAQVIYLRSTCMLHACCIEIWSGELGCCEHDPSSRCRWSAGCYLLRPA